MRRYPMAGLILRLLIVALGLALASELVPGIEVRGAGTLLGAALLLGIVNAVVRPDQRHSYQGRGASVDIAGMLNRLVSSLGILAASSSLALLVEDSIAASRAW